MLYLSFEDFQRTFGREAGVTLERWLFVALRAFISASIPQASHAISNS